MPVGAVGSPVAAVLHEPDEKNAHAHEQQRREQQRDGGAVFDAFHFAASFRAAFRTRSKLVRSAKLPPERVSPALM